MDNSIEALLFAEDLMKYIFEKCNFTYVPRDTYEVGKFRERIGTSPFRVVIGNAVCARIEEDLDELSDVFKKEFKTMLDAVAITNHMMKIASKWFPEGYDPAAFIEFCVMVSSISISYHEAGHHNISCFANEVIAAVLTVHIVSEDFSKKGGWSELIRECTQICYVARTKSLQI